MDRRTFLKAAAGTPILAATTAKAETPLIQGKKWPETVSLDNPIGHPFPVKFVEALPLVLRGQASSYEKELFRFTAHEWTSEAVLFRGMEIKLRDPSDLCNQEFLSISTTTSHWTDAGSAPS